jgi:ABC-type multidrug transport system fused ATPase/permease subunit
MALPRVLSGQRRTLFGFLVANGICQAGVAVISALLVKNGFDSLVTSEAPLTLHKALYFGGGLMAAILFGALLRWRGHLDAERLGQAYVHAVRVTLFRHVARIGADGARQMSRGAIMLRFVGDLTALRQWISLGLARLTVSGLATVLAVAALSLIEPVIAIAVAIALVVAATVALGIGPHLRVRTREARRHRGRLAAMLNDRISRIGVVEAFGQESRERKRFARLSRQLRNSLVHRARMIGLLRALSEASASFAGMCALFVGAVQVGLGQASPGSVVAAMVVAGLLAPRLQDLGRVYEYWNGAQIARRKQEELLRLKPVGRSAAKGESATLGTGPGRLQLRGVSREGIVEALDVVIEAGERVAVVGANGSGKSTLLRIIAGIVHPDEGEVLLDGQDISKCRWEEVRAAFAFVSPDLPLLRGSLRLNLTYGAKTPPIELVRKVIADCRLEPLIERLPDGIESRISENGEGLSTGERARIALARALLVESRVLLLDEAEANLDREALQALDQVTNAFKGSIVFVTHDLARAARADRILHLEAGHIAANGSPAALLKEGQPTARLFRQPLRVVS